MTTHRDEAHPGGRRLLHLALAAALAATALAVVQPAVAPAEAAPVAWSQFGNGPSHYGVNAAETQIIPSTVSALKPLFTATLRGVSDGPPVEQPGIATAGGTRDLLFTMGFSSIGMGLGTAVGAAIGRPDRPVVALVGDGGLMQCVGDLDTAARYGVNLLVVVYDDAAYGAEIHHLRRHQLAEETARFANPSFVSVAEALGVHAAKATSLGELAEQARAAMDRGGPHLIEVPINGDVLSRWFAHTMGAQPTP